MSKVLKIVFGKPLGVSSTSSILYDLNFENDTFILLTVMFFFRNGKNAKYVPTAN